MGGAYPSWNLLADLREMWSYPFMVNAFRAGTVVAVLAAVVGWFMVLRRQTFAGHTLALVGFPGATGAAWLGLSATGGYFAVSLAAALIIAAGSARGTRAPGDEAALIGTVQAYALAAGMLFVSLTGSFLGGTTAGLFGSILGVTTGQVGALAAVALTALTVLVAIGRPLLFASVDADVAAAHGVQTRWLNLAFLLLLGATTAAVGQITGALLVFALLVLPAATAQLLTARPVRAILASVALALLTVWASLFVAYYSPYPIGFWLTTFAFAGYVLTAAGRGVRRLRPSAATA